jgi:ABC-type branched-subunit amino acid transport system ATPase component/ABC-type branched-subunit amino acid transport system permease subunit
MSLRISALAAVALAAVCYLIVVGNGYELYIIALVGLTAVVGIGLNVLVGLTGQISLGHVAFYAIGAYAVGIFTTRFDWSFWLALPAAGLIAGAAGALLAIPALRVRGPYLAMVTIAFGFIVEQGAAEWSGLTGGWNGLLGIPTPAVFGFSFEERAIAFLALGLTLLSLVLYALLSASPWGKAMRAVRDSETASLSIGLDPTLIRTTAFAVSAVAAGIAGGLFASMTNFISPESFPFFQSILFLLVVMIGGAGSIAGPLVGAVVVVLLPEVLSFLAQYRLLFVGLLMLLVLRLAPTGFVGLVRPWFAQAPAPQAARPRRDVLAYLKAAAGGRGLSVQDLSIRFGGVQAVSGVSFAAQTGQITSIIGPNGAGKTTALNLICGFYQPSAGTIRLGNDDITRLSSHRVARAGVARTYQTSQLFGSMSVLDNVMIALRRGRLGPGSLFVPDREPEQLEIAESILAFLGYRGDVHQPADSLAHVDKRLVEIARALALRPSLLALDEPAAGLDSNDTEAIGGVLQKVADAGLTVMLIEHDMDLVMRVSRHVVVLDAGQKIAEGPPATIASDPAVLKAYLGEGKPKERARDRPPGIEAASLLECRGLAAGYGAANVLREIDIQVSESEVVAVLGANGAGKSTLMRALSGLNRPVDGEILFLGERIERFAANRIAGRGLVLVPEGRQVFPELSVLDNLRLGAFARPTTDTEAMVEKMLDRFPALRVRRNQRAGLLSGGEQQMLAIARGLMARPRVLMLDEPSLGLAPKLTEALYDLLAELRDEGVTILLVDQVAALALSVADRAYVLQSGRIGHSGAADAMRDDPALVRAYLGDHQERRKQAEV